VPLAAYSLATLTGISRIYDNKHWASDVFLGAALGYTMAELIWKANNWGIEPELFASQDALGFGIRIPLLHLFGVNGPVGYNCKK
jgi:membrane-associated phospholipid phosphatase